MYLNLIFLDTNSFIELIKALVPLLMFLFYLKYEKFNRASEVVKNVALGDVSFLSEAKYKLYKIENLKLIELEIKTTNISIKKLGVLAIFVRFKPVINKNLPELPQSLNFTSLAEFGGEISLSEFVNIGYIKGTLWQLTVNEFMSNKRFDIVNTEFCKKNPLIMAEIKLFCSSMDFIDKTHYPKYKIDKLRVPFCNYLEQKYSENYNFFAKMGKEGYKSKGFCVREAERILIKKDGSFDIENTKRFFPILTSVVGESLETIIELNKD